MKIRKGDKVLVRMTASESVAEDTRSRWFSALDRDGDEVTVCLDDVVAIEPKPLLEEPPVYSLVEGAGFAVFRRWPGGWGRVGAPADMNTVMTWAELNELVGEAIQIMVAKEVAE